MSFYDDHSDRTPYRQCALERGNTYRISWIPARFAVVGKVLKLRDNGVWDNGWTVTSVGAARLGALHVPGLIRRHERATGDSLPKRGAACRR